MTWAAVRNRYLAIYDDAGAGIAWHLAIGHYVANRWVAEDVLLQGRSYDPALTDPAWDDQLTLAELERLERAAIDGLETHLQSAQRAWDKAAFLEALREYGVADKAAIVAALEEHGAVTEQTLPVALNAQDRLGWSWFRRTLAEGPVNALGLILFGFAATLIAAIFSKPARAALGDLLGAAVHTFSGG